MTQQVNDKQAQSFAIGAAIVPLSLWNFAGIAGGIINTTVATTIAPAVSGLVNYLTGMGFSTDTLGAATEIVVRDGTGGTVIWRTKLQTTTLPYTHIEFKTPLKSTAGNLLEIVTLTATVSGGVYVNAQGFVAQ